MENLTNSAEEVLIDSLSFKLPSSGQYVTDRRSCTFHTQINVSRSLTKMKSVFASLDKSFADTNARKTFYNKCWNNFWSPNAGTGLTTTLTHGGEKFTHFQLQIGAKLFPEYPIKTHVEAFYSLRKALGIQANHLHSIDIDGNEYRSNKFIVGIDTEKLLGLSFTGMNTRNNLMTVHLKTRTGDNQADRMHIILLAEQISELGDTGSMVYHQREKLDFKL
jgi:hypothetical protein